MAGDAAGYAQRHNGEISQATLELAVNAISSLSFCPRGLIGILLRDARAGKKNSPYRGSVPVDVFFFIRAFDGATGRMASASPRKPAIFASAGRSTSRWYARMRGVKQNYRDVPGIRGILCRRQDHCHDSTA